MVGVLHRQRRELQMVLTISPRSSPEPLMTEVDPHRQSRACVGCASCHAREATVS